MHLGQNQDSDLQEQQKVSFLLIKERKIGVKQTGLYNILASGDDKVMGQLEDHSDSFQGESP